MTRGRDIGKLEMWRLRLAKFRSTGLTVVSFCRQEGIAPARFYYWARRVREAGEASDERAERSVGSRKTQMSQLDARSGSPSVELFIGSQIRVRLPAGDPELVATVVSRVGASQGDQDSQGASAAFQRIDFMPSTALAARR